MSATVAKMAKVAVAHECAIYGYVTGGHNTEREMAKIVMAHKVCKRRIHQR